MMQGAGSLDSIMKQSYQALSNIKTLTNTLSEAKVAGMLNSLDTPKSPEKTQDKTQNKSADTKAAQAKTPETKTVETTTTEAKTAPSTSQANTAITPFLNNNLYGNLSNMSFTELMNLSTKLPLTTQQSLMTGAMQPVDLSKLTLGVSPTPPASEADINASLYKVTSNLTNNIASLMPGMDWGGLFSGLFGQNIQPQVLPENQILGPFGGMMQGVFDSIRNSLMFYSATRNQ